jgi:octopine/nopaline transport system substrate-binding protein
MKKSITTALLAATACVSVMNSAQADDKKWEEIRIVTEGGFLPWNYTKPDGTLAGFEIDLAKDLCARMKVKCTVSADSFDGMIPALNAGKYDAIIDDLAITPKREEVIAFSVPYAALCYTFATLKDSDIAKALPANDAVYPLTDEAATQKAMDGVKSALKDKTIGTLAAGTSVAFVDQYLKGTALMRQYKSPQARDLDLVANRVDLIVGSKDSLLATSKKPGNENIVIAGPCFKGGVVGKGAGVGLRKSDPELKALFDKAIAEAVADGTIERLSKPVFGLDVTPR